MGNSTRSADRGPAGDLFFDDLVSAYVDENPRFLARDWLATELDDVLRRPGVRLVLLAGEPGAGKSAFVAQLARSHPEWLRYFIRRDQREPLGDVAARSVLLRLGYQLAALRPELFAQDQVRIAIEQRIGKVAAHGDVVGVEVKRLLASPFLQKALTIQQHVRRTHGSVVGLRVDELVVDSRLLALEDLTCLALLDPARSLQRLDASDRIVVVIDGLDEIRYHPATDDVLNWLINLSELPDNVRFVLTSRPPDERLRLLRDKQSECLRGLTLDEDLPKVRDDVQVFVNRLAAEPALRRRLEATGAADGFTQRAVERANGNLGYVDALARGLDEAIARDDSRSLDALLSMRELPADLEDLYAFFLHQIKASVAGDRVELEDPETGETYDKPAWPAIHSRVLAVLAVAAEPLDAGLITWLGAIRAEPSWIRWALDDLRQFLDVVDDRYRLYHASLAEFLVADSTRTDASASDLYSSPARSHRQIADRYWALRADWTACDGYGLRHLAEHLDRVGDARRLEELVSQGWMDARFTGDGYRYDGFLADLRIAWRAAHREACRQLDADVEPSAIAASFRHLLVNASILAQSANYPPALLARLLETEVWDVGRVLSVAFRVTDDAKRVAVLTALLDTGRLPVDAYDRARRDALAAAATLTDPNCGRAVQRLAPHLDGELLESAWGTVQHIRGKWHEVRAPAMAALAPRFSGGRRDEALRDALKAAFDTDGDNEVEYSLPLLAPHFDRPLLDEALTMALAPGQTGPGAIAALAPYLDAAQRDRALTGIRDVADREDTDSARSSMLQRIAPLQEQEPIERRLSLALSLEGADDRVAAVAALAPRLDERQLKSAVAQALGIQNAGDWSELLPLMPDDLLEDLIPRLPSQLLATNVDRLLPTGTAPRPGLLAALGPQLHGELEARAMVALVTLGTWGQAAMVLAEWADHLNESQLVQALQVVLQIESLDSREAALVALVPRLSADALQRVLPALRGIDDDYNRHGVALQVCPSSEVSMLERILQPDFERAERTGRLGHLAQLAPDVPGPLRERALQLAERSDDDYGRAELVRARASDLNDAAQERAVGVASAIASEDLRADTLKVLVPHLRQDLLDRVLEAGETMEARVRARLVAALAPRLTGARRRQACEEALAVALPLSTFIKARERAALLVSIAPVLDSDVVEELLGEHWASEARASHRDVLVSLAPKLTMGQLQQVLDLVRQWRPDDTAHVLVALAPYLSDAQLEEAVAATPHAMWGPARARALAALAPQFSSRARRLLVFSEALDSLRTPLYGYSCLDLLEALAGCLPDELWQRGLDTAQAVEEPGYRACALASFLPTAPEPRHVRSLVRRAIAQHIFEELSDRSRPDLVWPSGGLRCDVLAAPWLAPTTLAAMASAVLEVDGEWSWL